MAKRIIDIYFNVLTKRHQNSSGEALAEADYPSIQYTEKPLVRCNLVIDNSNTPFTDLAGTETFSAAIDNDFSHADDPMCKTLNANINVGGDWSAGGTADPTQGQVSVRLDADNTAYQTAIASSKRLRGCWFEIKALEAGTGDLIASFLMPFKCYNILDDAGSVPPAPTEDYYTKTESDARFAAAGEGFDFITDDVGNKGVALVNSDGVQVAEFWPAGV